MGRKDSEGYRAMAVVARLIVLGASNLTRGFRTIVAAARTVWGPDIQVLGALGHGRSYGAQSTVLVRTLPGIRDAGLWERLDAMPRVATKALVTDVGNDILYGFAADQTLTWVAEAVARLQRQTSDITLMDLPLASICRLSPQKFRVFRSILFPSCRLSLPQVRRTAERVSQGLADLATGHHLRLFKPDPAWYGLDPIHIRPSFGRAAWQAMLGLEGLAKGARSSLADGLRLYFMAPERRWLFGVEQVTPQKGLRLPSGGRVWLY